MPVTTSYLRIANHSTPAHLLFEITALSRDLGVPVYREALRVRCYKPEVQSCRTQLHRRQVR